MDWTPNQQHRKILAYRNNSLMHFPLFVKCVKAAFNVLCRDSMKPINYFLISSNTKHILDLSRCFFENY